jgi:hypothetical protein
MPIQESIPGQIVDKFLILPGREFVQERLSLHLFPEKPAEASHL